jgi:hypothetical protein
MNVHVVSLSIANTVVCFECIHFHNQQNGCTGHIPFHKHRYIHAGCVSFHSQQNGRAGCNHFHSQEYGLVVRREYAYPPPVGTYRCIPFHRQQYERKGCVPFWCAGCVPFWMGRVRPFLPPAVWTCRMYPLFKMPECQTVWYPVSPVL